MREKPLSERQGRFIGLRRRFIAVYCPFDGARHLTLRRGRCWEFTWARRVCISCRLDLRAKGVRL